MALWWSATAVALACVALRRRWPLAMLAICILSAAVHVAQAVPFLIVDLAVPILLYTVAVRHARSVSLGLLSGLLLLVTGWSLYTAANALPVPGLPGRINPTIRQPIGTSPVPSRPPVSVIQQTWSGVVVLGSVLVASWAMGAGARTRSAYLDELHSRAKDLERERDQRATLAVTAERGRISRELHDIVAHGLSVMVAQAQGAAAALEKRPTDTQAALSAIVKTGRDSLADMRRVLARVDGVDGLDDTWHPQPGLDRLPLLVAQVTEAGTPVRLHVEGSPAALPPEVDLSTYRIVQEALTNTMKHAGTGATADVILRYRDSGLEIEIRDDGHRRTSPHTAGNGLHGMSERARLLGGSLTAGPRTAGGFSVRAELPIQGPNR
ncbi:sensor histidine kinase [Kribbella sp. VKM Ac-2566]|uniref:sensor histidine kinase n=1 Tax=Kribbella sp. VKM Ac-2566 TaxID=2512218 RepID=UPI001EDD8504|nr:sensor histidine kinase [Kribbella sp. VKM Ac-2566]